MQREEEAAVPRTVVQTVRAKALNSSENGPGPEQGSRADNGHVLDQKWKSLKSPDQAWKLEQSTFVCDNFNLGGDGGGGGGGMRDHVCVCVDRCA